MENSEREVITMERRTRLGKVVGSIRTTGGWTYWPENDWRTGEPGFMVVAPSGARMNWFASEQDAKDEVARENAE